MDSINSHGPAPMGANLFRIGGAAALVCAVMYLVALVVYVPASLAAPPPESVLDWFALFQIAPLTGLFFLGLADIVIMTLWCPMSLALYAALSPTNKAWSTIAAALVFVGIAVYLSTNTAFSMLSLSNRFAAATTQSDRSILLAAGQAILAVSEGTGGQYMGMPLAWLGGLILSIVMLGSRPFGRTTALTGILGLALLLAGMPFAGYATTGPTTPVVSAIVGVSYVGGGLLSLAWYVLVGVRLLKLGRMGQG